MRHLPVLAVLALALPLAGCLEFKQQAAQALLPAPVAQPAWAPVPVAVAIHPATRVRAEGKKWVVDVRVRMVDGLGDYTKCSGMWRFELRAIGSGAARHDDLIYLWMEKVRTLAEHQDKFDAATRAYRFTLDLDKELPPGVPMQLLVVFSPEGSTGRMAAEAALTH